MRLRENDILTTVLLRRFLAEAHQDGGDGRHYGLILRDDGSLFSHHPGSPLLDPVQLMWANDVLKLLNKELHHDGAWVVVFTHVQIPSTAAIFNPGHAEYGRYALIWLDEDADPQFTMEWEIGITTDLRDFADVLMQGLHATAQKAETSWQIWHTQMRQVLAPKACQLYRRAKGEKAPSLN